MGELYYVRERGGNGPVLKFGDCRQGERVLEVVVYIFNVSMCTSCFIRSRVGKIIRKIRRHFVLTSFQFKLFS